MLASRYDNYPCVLIEAVACGVPVVATRVGGAPEVVSADVGVLVDAGDTEALAGAVTELLEDKKRFDPARISKLTIERYGRSSIARRLADAYAEVQER